MEAGKETYTYDAVGNRLEKKTESYVEGYSYDERNRLVQKQLWESGTSVPTDTTTYTYDAQGSLLSEQGTDFCQKYLYNDFHQCIRTEVIRGREEEAERILQENRYDGEGLRFSLIENGKRTDFITNGWENMAELDESGKVTKRIIRGMGSWQVRMQKRTSSMQPPPSQEPLFTTTTTATNVWMWNTSRTKLVK